MFAGPTIRTLVIGADSAVSGVPANRTLTAGDGVAGGGDLTADRTFAVKPHPDGSIIVDGDGVRVATVVETADAIPVPQVRLASGNATRVCQTTLEGASYVLLTKTSLSRIVGRVTAVTAPGAIRFGIYQTSDGASGVADLVAQFTGFAPGASGNFSLLNDATTAFTLKPGIFFVLFGRESATGSVTLRSYSVSALDLINQNMDAALYATNFTTALLANAAFPATFDPRESPTGSATSSINNLAPVLRLKA